jgi:hypothetical protein
LTVIRTEFDKKIGGFSVPEWGSQSGRAVDNSKESFIFSLTNNDEFTLSQQPNHTIYKDPSYGPMFGDGNDLIVHDKAN